MFPFLVGSLFPLLAIVFGIKALTPAGIEMWEGKKLPRRASIVIGLTTIVFSLLVIGVLFAYCILRLPLI